MALAAALGGCSIREPERPHWGRSDGGEFDRADLERDHGTCLSLYGKPDRSDGNDMARWVVAFGGCMRDRGWQEAAP